MNRVTGFVASVFALTLVLVISQAVRADDNPPTATGSVSVSVTDKDGKPVEGVTVRITAHKAAKGEKDATTQPSGDAAAPSGAKATPVAEGKTDKDGKATLDSVPAGDYNLSANLKGQGNARQKITVKAGEPLSVDLKLSPKAAKGG